MAEGFQLDAFQNDAFQAGAAALSIVNKDTFASQTDAASYASTGGATPAANSMLLVAFEWEQAGGVDPPDVQSVTGYGLTWEQVYLSEYDVTSVTHSFAIWGAMVGASPSAGNVTITFVGTATGIALSVDDVLNITPGGAPHSYFKKFATPAGGTSTSGSVSLGSLASSDNAAYGVITHEANETTTKGAALALLGEAHHNTPPGGLLSEWALNVTTVDASWATSVQWEAFAAEIMPVAAAVIPQTIAATTTVTAGVLAQRVFTKLIAITSALTAAVDAVKLLWENSAEGGTDTQAVTTGNSGGASGKAWNTVNNGTNGTTTYDSSPKIENLSVAYAGGGSASIDYLGWTLPGSITVAFARVYINLTAPGSAYRLVNLMNGANVSYDIRMQGAGGKFGLYANNVLIQSASQTPQNGKWIRLELTADAATGVCTARIFYNPNATSPDETLTGTGATQAALTAVRFGVPTSQTFSDFNMDEFGISFTDWMGPGANVPGGTTLQSVDSAATLTPLLIRSTRKPVPATMTATAALVKSPRKTIAAAMTVIALLTRVTRKGVAAATTVTAALTRKNAETIAAATTVTVAVARRVGKAVSIVVALWWPGPILSNRISRSIPATVTAIPALSFTKKLGQTIAAAATATVGLVRRTGKGVAAGVAGTIALSTKKLAVKAVAVTSAIGVGLARATRKTIAAGATVVAALNASFQSGSHQTLQTIAASVTVGVAVNRRMYEILAAGVSGTITIVRTKLGVKAVAVTSTLGVALTRVTRKPVAVLSTLSVALVRRTAKLVTTWMQLSPQGAEFARWSVTAGSPSYSVATDTWTLHTGDIITSPLIPCDTPNWRVVAIFLTDGQSQEPTFQPNGGMLWSSLYFKGDGVTAALNSSAYTDNGNAQQIPIGVATEKQWSFNGGNEVRYVRYAITADDHYVGTGNTITVRDVMAFMGTSPVGTTPRLVMRQVAHQVGVVVGVGVALLRRTGKLVPVSAALVIALSRRVTRTVAAATSLAVTLLRSIGKPVAVVITATVTLVRIKVAIVVVAVTSAIVTVLVRLPRKVINIGTPVLVGITRRLVRTIAVVITNTVALAFTKVVLKAVAATASLTVAITRKMGKAVIVTTVTTIATGIVKAIHKRIDVVVGALFESHITDPDAHFEIYGVRVAAQTFTPQTTHLMPVVSLLLHTDQLPPNPLTVELRATVGGVPSGSVLASGSIQPPAAPIAHADAIYFQAQLSPHVVVSSGTLYAIVAYTTAGNSNNDWHWIDDNTAADYTGGTEWLATDGSTWAQFNGQDFLFNEYGTMVNITRRTTRALAVTTTLGVAVLRRTGKAVASAVSMTVAITRKITHAIAVGVTVLASVLKRAPKHVDVTTTLAVAMGGIKTLMRSIAAGTTFTAALARRTGKLVATSVTYAVGLGMLKALHVAVAASSAVVAGITRRSTHVVAAGVSMVAALARRVGKLVALSSTMVMALGAIKTFTRAIAAGVTMSVGLARRTAKSVALVVTSAAAVAARATYHRAIAITVTLGVGITRRSTKAVAVALSTVVAVLRRIPQRVTTTTTFVAALGAIKTFTRAIAVSASFAVALGRRTGKLIAASTTVAVSLGMHKALSQAVAVAVVIQAVIAGRVGKLLAVAVPLAATMRRGITRRVAVVTSLAVNILHGGQHFVTVAVNVAMDALAEAEKPAAKLWAVSVDVTAVFVAEISRSVGKLISTSVSFVVGVIRRLLDLVWPVSTSTTWDISTPHSAWPSDTHHPDWPPEDFP